MNRTFAEPLLKQMLHALDAGDSERYWKAFEAFLSLHQEFLKEEAFPARPSDVKGSVHANPQSAGVAG